MQLAFDRGLFKVAAAVPELQGNLHGALGLYPQQDLVIGVRLKLKRKQEVRVLNRSLPEGFLVARAFMVNNVAIPDQVKVDMIQLRVADFQQADEFRVADRKAKPDMVSDVAEIGCFLRQYLPIVRGHCLLGRELNARRQAEILHLRNIRNACRLRLKRQSYHQKQQGQKLSRVHQSHRLPLLSLC